MRYTVLYRVIRHEMVEIEAESAQEAMTTIETEELKQAILSDGVWEVEIDRVLPKQVE